MPKRTNDFQKLVAIVKKHASDAALVTESKMLRDRLTGAPREVDVCIETAVAGHPVIVSIECRDQGRPVAVGWVEEMRAKHDRLSTNALVLVSRSGFTAEAERVAAAYGIEILRFSEVTGSRVETLLSGSSSLWGKTFQLAAAKVVAHMAPTPELPAEIVATFPANHVYSARGEFLGTMRELTEVFLKWDEVGKRLGLEGNENHKWFEVEWTVPPDIQDGGLYLEKLEPRALRRIEKVRVAGHCEFTISEFRLRRGQLGAVPVAWGTGSLFGKETTLIASAHESGGGKLTISFKKP
jgi:hypothetical protein